MVQFGRTDLFSKTAYNKPPVRATERVYAETLRFWSEHVYMNHCPTVNLGSSKSIQWRMQPDLRMAFDSFGFNSVPVYTLLPLDHGPLLT